MRHGEVEASPVGRELRRKERRNGSSKRTSNRTQRPSFRFITDSPVEFSVEIRPTPLYLLIGHLKQIPIGYWSKRIYRLNQSRTSTRVLLTKGTRLGPYEITALSGVGGMSEVYRARNRKLGRDVAIKMLPASFARDVERLARLYREARILAALNHPQISAIYGLEQSNGIQALVLELVEGSTLAEKLDEMILGTATYMSPEQARGQPVDERHSVSPRAVKREWAEAKGWLHARLSGGAQQ